MRQFEEKVMKFLLGLMLLFTVHITEANIVGEFSKDGNYNVKLTLPIEDSFAIALKNALTNTPEVKEVVHEYSPPGTNWKGNGISVHVLGHGYIEFKFNSIIGETNKITLAPNYTQFTGKVLPSAIYSALKTSTSTHVVKKGTQNESQYGHGQSFSILAETEKGKARMMLSCSPYYDNNRIIHCEINRYN